MQFQVIMAGNFKLFMEERGYDSTTIPPFQPREKILLKVKKGSHLKNTGVSLPHSLHTAYMGMKIAPNKINLPYKGCYIRALWVEHFF